MVDPKIYNQKDAEKIVVGNWPGTVADYKNWRLKVVDEVVGASAAPELAFTWIVSVAKATSLDVLSDFHHPWTSETAPKEYRFSGLDAKLSASLSRIISGEFEKKIQTMKLEAMSTGKRVTGRQMLHLIDQHFKLNEKDGAVYGLEHLLAVTMKGHQLEKFYC